MTKSEPPPPAPQDTPTKKTKATGNRLEASLKDCGITFTHNYGQCMGDAGLHTYYADSPKESVTILYLNFLETYFKLVGKILLKKLSKTNSLKEMHNFRGGHFGGSRLLGGSYDKGIIMIETLPILIPEPYISIFSHEFGHAIYFYLIELDPTLSEKLEHAYELIMSKHSKVFVKSFLPEDYPLSDYETTLLSRYAFTCKQRLQELGRGVDEYFAEFNLFYVLYGDDLRKHIKKLDPKTAGAYQFFYNTFKEAYSREFGSKDLNKIKKIISELRNIDRDMKKEKN